MNNFSLQLRIQGALVKLRNSKGLTRAEVAEPLRKEWDASLTSAACYVSRLETQIDSLSPADSQYRGADGKRYAEVQAQRFADYLSALGATPSETREVYSLMREYRPDFKKVKSRVKTVT